ncbi:LPKTxAVK-anchored surface protein [Streptococcus sp. oral taxon 431]|uniref:LPKTxAVK-anchored surface protein n=1 Tax=Streptococcus sp. oral taxon 431 TaxID=712633 RepID=UPI000A877ADE|nr:LPKTxAVK-anchored surface protein [Streptococcus sp. oral taxon 431]
MKKVLLSSVVALTVFSAFQAVSADNGVVPADKQYKPAQPVKDPRHPENDNGYGAPSLVKGTVTVTVVDLSTGKPVEGATVDFNAGGKYSSSTTGANGVATLEGVEPGTDVAYRLNVPAGYAEDSFVGHVKAVAGNVPATFSIRPATLENNRPTIHPSKPAATTGDGSAQQAANNAGQAATQPEPGKPGATDQAKKADDAAKKAGVDAKSGQKALPKTHAAK